MPTEEATELEIADEMESDDDDEDAEEDSLAENLQEIESSWKNMEGGETQHPQQPSEVFSRGASELEPFSLGSSRTGVTSQDSYNPSLKGQRANGDIPFS